MASDVRRDLLGLRKEVADAVSSHLVAAGSLLEDDPEQALVHARYARGRAARLAVVREAVGLAAYHAGEWSEAIAELRAARRMGGGPGHIAVMADAERALGRPERALELTRGPEVAELEEADAIELRIVAAGARRDLGELDAAVLSLQIPELDPARRQPWSVRLFYAYADALLAAGRQDDAVRWFLHATDADDEESTDAADRLAELNGQSPAIREAPAGARSGGTGAPESPVVGSSAPDRTGRDSAAGDQPEADQDAGPQPEADQDTDAQPEADQVAETHPEADGGTDLDPEVEPVLAVGPDEPGEASEAGEPDGLGGPDKPDTSDEPGEAAREDGAAAGTRSGS